jgi:hypothetical protein
VPYNYPVAGKTSCSQVLGFIRDRADAGNCATVYDVEKFLSGVRYQTAAHRRNDASQRLRTLEKSGYIRKVSGTYRDGRVGAEAAAEALKELAGSRGRPASIYAITDVGVRYARTLADLYIDEKGIVIDRAQVLKSLKNAFILVEREGWRAIAVAPGEKSAEKALRAWSITNGKRFNVSKIMPALESV